MPTWTDDFSHDYIADSTYTLVDEVDTGMGYSIANGKLTFDGGGWQQFLDPRWPGSDVASNFISVDVDASSGPASLLTIGWSSADWQNILSNVSASLQFNTPTNDYFTLIQIYGWDNATHQLVGSVGDGDQHALVGLVPPFTFEIATAVTPTAYTATMSVVKGGRTLYTKTVGTNENIWSWAMMGGLGSFPGINGRSFRAVRFAPVEPDLVLDSWSHSIPTPPVHSVVHLGRQRLGIVRPKHSRPVGLLGGSVRVA